MKKNLFKALENANKELSKKDQVVIDADLMSHIGGVKREGLSLSGECTSDDPFGNEEQNRCWCCIPAVEIVISLPV